MNDRPRWQRRLLTGLCWFVALQLFFFAPFISMTHRDRGM